MRLIDEAEQHHLHDGQRQRQAQRSRVTEDVQELLAEDGEERPPHVRPPPRRRARAASSVSLTNTSSSDAWISRIVAAGKPPCAHVGEDLGVVLVARDDGVDRLAEDRRAEAPGLLPDPRQHARGLGRLDLDAARVGRVHLGARLQRLRRAGHQQLRHVEVADLAAALGLVHVVGGDQERDPLRGQREQQVPQLAARDRIDAGGRLVEEDDARLVHQRGAQRQPLLPAARQQPGAPIEVRARCA